MNTMYQYVNICLWDPLVFTSISHHFFLNQNFISIVFIVPKDDVTGLSHLHLNDDEWFGSMVCDSCSEKEGNIMFSPFDGPV